MDNSDDVYEDNESGLRKAYLREEQDESGPHPFSREEQDESGPSAWGYNSWEEMALYEAFDGRKDLYDDWENG